MDSTSGLRWTGYFGVAAAVVYIGATAGGSFLDPAYSQVSQHVSDLTGTGAPTRDELSPLYLLYNVLVVFFAIGLYRASEASRLFKLSAGLLTLSAFAGVMMVTLFTVDLGGAPTTFAGNGHIAFAGISSLAILVASIVYGFAFRSTKWHSLSVFSFVIAAAFVLSAPIAIIATAANNYAGLAERAAIAPFIFWLLVTGGYVLLQGYRRAEPRLESTTRTA